MIKSAIDLLGLRATDKVTGFSGTVTSVGFDLFGCVQVIISPPVDKEGKIPEGRWFDTNRLQLGERVMPVPNFAQRTTPVLEHDQGPAEKSAPSRAPGA